MILAFAVFDTNPECDRRMDRQMDTQAMAKMCEGFCYCT